MSRPFGRTAGGPWYSLPTMLALCQYFLHTWIMGDLDSDDQAAVDIAEAQAEASVAIAEAQAEASVEVAHEEAQATEAAAEVLGAALAEASTGHDERVAVLEAQVRTLESELAELRSAQAATESATEAVAGDVAEMAGTQDEETTGPAEPEITEIEPEPEPPPVAAKRREAAYLSRHQQHHARRFR